MLNLDNQLKELESMQFDEDKIVQLEKFIELKKQEKDKISQKNIEINSRISSLKIKNEENKKLKDKISNLKVCPTCLQEVDAVYRANVLNKAHSDNSANNQEIEILEEEKNKIAEKIGLFFSEISLKEKELTNLKILKMKLGDLPDKRKRINEIINSNLVLEKDITLLKNHDKDLNQSIYELKKYDSIFESKKIEFDDSSRKERIAEIKLAELKKELEVFLKYIEELKERIIEAEKLKKKLNYLAELESWITNNFSPVISFIEKNVMIKLKSEFSHLFSEWFSVLVSDTFNVSLDDKFTPVIEQQDYEIDYAYLSGGERTAIALAYRLALNQVINSLMSKIKTRELVILDEPTDGFSDQQLDKMREILDQLEVKQLIIVSHEQKIEGFVEKVIKFKKINGISYLEG